jgi:hypothetical protein
MNWKFWSYAAVLVFGVLVGIGIGVVGTANKPKAVEPVRYVVTVNVPVDCPDYTSELHELKILREAAKVEQEIREAKNYFARENKTRMGQYRYEQQRCVEEQELGK